MGWSWAAACSVAFVLVLVHAESEERFQESDMGQRPLDMSELWEPIDFPDMEQREVPLDPGVIQALKKGQFSNVAQMEVTHDLGADPQGGPVFGPRSFGPRSLAPPSQEDSFLKILFPPARPSLGNLQAICFQDNRRPRYRISSLPQTGFGYLQRQAGTINRVESWYSKCCQGNKTQDQKVTLCCVRQAWEETLKQYCEEEFSIKTSHHPCCKKKGEARLSCFHGDAPNPTYQDPETLYPTDPGFTFDPSTCHRYGEQTEDSRWDGTFMPQANVAVETVANGRPTLHLPDVVFPPAQPSTNNLRAICFLGNRRPRYSARFLSSTGHLIEAGNAINRVESWYNKCCQGNKTQGQEVTLCCVRQAWEETLHQYCEEEFSIKGTQPPCCKKEGEARLSCFHGDAPNPTYQVPDTLEPGFTFDPRTCPRTVLGPRSIQEQRERKQLRATTQTANINFPPGRPTSDNIQSICLFGKARPVYQPRCLPRTGYGWLVRQSKAVNRLEKWFKHCCKGKKNVLTCADWKWRKVMDKFCREEGKHSRISCCKIVQSEEQYACFSSLAPNPAYSKELHVMQAGLDEPTLGQICNTQKVVKKKLGVGFPVETLVTQCCSLPDNERTTCVQEKLASLTESLCSEVQPSSPVQGCCSSGSQDLPKCFSDLIMDAVTQATKTPGLKTLKCPLA